MIKIDKNQPLYDFSNTLPGLSKLQKQLEVIECKARSLYADNCSIPNAFLAGQYALQSKSLIIKAKLRGEENEICFTSSQKIEELARKIWARVPNDSKKDLVNRMIHSTQVRALSVQNQTIELLEKVDISIQSESKALAKSAWQSYNKVVELQKQCPRFRSEHTNAIDNANFYFYEAVDTSVDAICRLRQEMIFFSKL